MTAELVSLSDSELLAAYAAGSEEAFGEVARRHGTMVWRAARRVLGDEHEAEDAAQAAFLVLARRSRSFRRGGDLAGWLHGIAARTALEARRSRAARRGREEEAAMTRREVSGGAEIAEQAEALGRLDKELARLPALQRQAVVLRHLEGRSQEEAARLAGCPVGTLSRRAADGVARLRERLARRGTPLGAAALAGLFTAQASGAVPETLLPSLLAVPKLAAAGAAAGVAGGTLAVTLAEGVLKAMLWTKMKFAAAVLAAAAAVGASSPLVYRAAAGDGAPPAGPAETGAKSEVVAAPAEAQAVNGLKLLLEPNYEITLRKGARTVSPAEYGLPERQWTEEKDISFTCDILEDRGESLLVDIYAGQHARMIFQKADMISRTPVVKWPKLRWENVGKEPLGLMRRRASDLRVFLKNADGKLAPAREYAARGIDPPVRVSIQPGKADVEPFYPHAWVVWPTEPGEYTVWVEFENQAVPAQSKNAGERHWTGRARSNELKIRVEAPAAGQAGAAALDHAQKKALPAGGGGGPATLWSEEAGVPWLARVQEPDGHWNSAKYGARPADDVAATAAATLSMLGAGYTDRTGKYQDNVQRALGWLSAWEEKLPERERAALAPRAAMLASLALSEAHAMSGFGTAEQAARWRKLGERWPDPGRLAEGDRTRFGPSCALWLETVAAFGRGGTEWRGFNERMKKELILSQERGSAEAGSWPGREEESDRNEGRVLTTALSVMCLEVYYRYLPVLREGQRPGPTPPGEVF